MIPGKSHPRISGESRFCGIDKWESFARVIGRIQNPAYSQPVPLQIMIKHLGVASAAVDTLLEFLGKDSGLAQLESAGVTKES